jgi:hypothetical protein
MFIEAIHICKTIGAWNYNRENELDCDREDEEARLLERLRNLDITPSDDGHMGLTAREAKELL